MKRLIVCLILLGCIMLTGKGHALSPVNPEKQMRVPSTVSQLCYFVGGDAGTCVFVDTGTLEVDKERGQVCFRATLPNDDLGKYTCVFPNPKNKTTLAGKPVFGADTAGRQSSVCMRFFEELVEASIVEREMCFGGASSQKLKAKYEMLDMCLGHARAAGLTTTTAADLGAMEFLNVEANTNKMMAAGCPAPGPIPLPFVDVNEEMCRNLFKLSLKAFRQESAEFAACKKRFSDMYEEIVLGINDNDNMPAKDAVAVEDKREENESDVSVTVVDDSGMAPESFTSTVDDSGMGTNVKPKNVGRILELNTDKPSREESSFFGWTPKEGDDFYGLGNFGENGESKEEPYYFKGGR